MKYGRNKLVGKRQPPSLVRGPHSFICLQKASIHTFVRLTINRTEEFRVPKPGRFFAGGVPLVLLRLACVDEVVGVVVAQSPAHDERALPWRGQLVLACLLLDVSENEVAFAECERLDLLAVVVPQALLVDSRAAKCQKARLFEQVYTVFACFSCFCFGVHRDARRVELDVGRDDGFCSVDEEEQGEPDRPVRRGAETPENSRQLIVSAAGGTDERLDEPWLDAG